MVSFAVQLAEMVGRLARLLGDVEALGEDKNRSREIVAMTTRNYQEWKLEFVPEVE